ncbi:MAG: 23S rRNA pseudouridine(2605) synthase RluB [Burkholderiales bacterium]|jgi:23S rRNA pseudouridine2605 synthase
MAPRSRDDWRNDQIMEGRRRLRDTPLEEGSAGGQQRRNERNKPQAQTDGQPRQQAPRARGANTVVAKDRGETVVVARAKKMRERQGSQKERDRADHLREKRVDPKSLDDMRLQKILALTGLGSRRDMEEAISAGRVEVNGKVAALGDKVAYGDRVRLDGKNVALKWPDRLPRVILYHKQEGEIVSRDDPEGRVSVFARLPKVSSSRWIAIGRLDFNTSGLLIFTTSGELANVMMHPRFEVEREYAVRVLGELTDEQMKLLTKGIELEDGVAQFNYISDEGGEGSNRWYRVILREGRNREVRRMFEHFGLTVSRLMRVRFGPVSLPGRLKRGNWTELEPQDVQKLLRWAKVES